MTPPVSQATCKESLPSVNDSLRSADIRPESGFLEAALSGNQLAFPDLTRSGKPHRSERATADAPPEWVPTGAAEKSSGDGSSEAGANRRLGRRTALQTSRLVKALALVLFFLFPLLSIVQLRDTDAPWRQVAQSIRPSVVTLMRSDGVSATCALVIQSRPLRIATVGALPAGGVSSIIQGEKVTWSPILVDQDKQFTILQADSDLHGETEGASSLVHAVPAARLDLQGAGQPREDVKAALVGPLELQVESLWVGILRSSEPTSEKVLYRAHLLRHVSEMAGVATSSAWAEETGQIDPSLRGAPFVDEHGQVVALYLDRDAHRVRALPIEFISRSLVFLHLQAAQ